MLWMLYLKKVDLCQVVSLVAATAFCWQIFNYFTKSLSAQVASAKKEGK